MLDNDGLVILKKGDKLSNQGVYIDSKFYKFDSICSAYCFHITDGLWDTLSRLDISKLRVRLNPQYTSPPKGFQKTAVKIWGVKFDLNKIVKAQSAEEINHINPDDNEILQCAWHPDHNNEIYHIKIELLPKLDNGIVFTRFLHATIEKNNIKINHTDGAIIQYNSEDYEKRLHTTLLKSNKSNNYNKIFRYDNMIEEKLWFKLVETFFYPSPLLKELFSKI